LDDYPGFLNLIDSINPDQCTLVPDDSSQLTSDHGWNINSEHNKLSTVLGFLRQSKIRSSIFVDPDKSQLDAAKNIGVDRVELYTGPFAEAFIKNDEKTLSTYQEAISYANDISLELNAGHDLNLDNLALLLSYGDIKEVSIGHGLITEALIYGIENTIEKYIKIIS
jgi:pyridoxine 5-phosphate synthase